MEKHEVFETYNLTTAELSFADLVRLLISPIKNKKDRIRIVFPNQLPDSDPFKKWYEKFILPGRPKLTEATFVACFLYDRKLMATLGVNSGITMINDNKVVNFLSYFSHIYHVPELIGTDKGEFEPKYCEIWYFMIDKLMEYLTEHLKELEEKRSGLTFVEEEPMEECQPGIEERNGDFICSECGEDGEHFFINEDDQIQCPACGNIKRD